MPIVFTYRARLAAPHAVARAMLFSGREGPRS